MQAALCFATFVYEVGRALLAQGMPAADEYATNTDLEGQIEHVRPIHVFEGEVKHVISQSAVRAVLQGEG